MNSTQLISNRIKKRNQTDRFYVCHVAFAHYRPTSIYFMHWCKQTVEEVQKGIPEKSSAVSQTSSGFTSANVLAVTTPASDSAYVGHDYSQYYAQLEQYKQYQNLYNSSTMVGSSVGLATGYYFILSFYLLHSRTMTQITQHTNSTGSIINSTILGIFKTSLTPLLRNV